MKTIQFNNVKGILQTHHIFEDIEEFTMFHGGNPPTLIEDWKIGQVGDWVLADDGKICQVLYRKNELVHPRDSGGENTYSYHRGYLRTAVMATVINDNPNTKLDCDEAKHPSRYRFGNAKIVNQYSKIQTRKDLTKSERVFIFNLLHRGFSLEKAYQSAYKTNKSTGTALLKKAMLLIKQERIMSEIKKEVEEAAGSLGITHKSVLERTLQFANDTNINPQVALDAIKMLGKAIGTFEPKQHNQQRLIGGYGETIIELTSKDIDLVEGVEINMPKIEGEVIDE